MKLLSVVGARPQFIKAAAVYRAISEHNSQNPSDPVNEILVHTGQHYDDNMSEVFFNELHIRKPDYNLGIGSGLQGAQTGKMLEAVEQVIIRESPDIVLVYGDTNSTLAGAMASAKLHIRVAHIEAGLRSFNRKMPEEINRIITDHISSFLFCPSETAVENLEKEGFNNIVNGGKFDESMYEHQPSLPFAVNTGDVMYDASLYYRKLAQSNSRILQRLSITEKGYVLATIHRAENTDSAIRLKEIISGLLLISKEMPVVFPLHPRTRAALRLHALEPLISSAAGIFLTDPLSYIDMICLEQAARVILTDSGGVQKEAFFYDVPCITARDETEWVETVRSGRNMLAGADEQKILSLFFAALEPQLKKDIHPYGNGSAAKTIVSYILNSREA